MTVRTTIDLPDDLHRITTSIAKDTSRSLSETVADLVRRGLGRPSGVTMAIDEQTGFPVLSTGVPITVEDVRSLDDDE